MDLTCKRCNATWTPRNKNSLPVQCPRCHSVLWNKDRREAKTAIVESYIRPGVVIAPRPVRAPLHDKFVEIYGYCGGEAEHAEIARQLGCPPERLAQYLDGTLEVTQAHIEAITVIWNKQ